MKKIGFTGTQYGMTSSQIKELRCYLLLLDDAREFHHGDCIGADAQAHKLVETIIGYEIHVHPPADSRKRAFCEKGVIYPPRPYLMRNHDIVDKCDVLIAAPKSRREELRSGTWATVRYARKKNKVIYFLYP